jgi:hypothetical protein
MLSNVREAVLSKKGFILVTSISVFLDKQVVDRDREFLGNHVHLLGMFP